MSGGVNIEMVPGPPKLRTVQTVLCSVRAEYDSPVGKCGEISPVLQNELADNGFDTVLIDGGVQFPDTGMIPHTWLYLHVPMFDYEHPFILVDPTIDQFSKKWSTHAQSETTRENLPESFLVWPHDTSVLSYYSVQPAWVSDYYPATHYAHDPNEE